MVTFYFHEHFLAQTGQILKKRLRRFNRHRDRTQAEPTDSSPLNLP